MSPSPLVVPLPSGRVATLTPADSGFPARVRVIVEGGGAQVFVEESCKIGSSVSRQRLASAARLSDAEVEIISAKVIEWVDQINKEFLANEKKQSEDASTPKAYGLVLRQMTQPRENGMVYPSGEPAEVVQLLQKNGFVHDSVLEWDADKIDRLVILDLDFHRGDAPKPTEQDLDELGYGLSPTPWMWWRTQGGGLHALYAQADKSIFTALELGTGAMAQLLVHPVVVRCKGTVELVPRTRHPGALQKGLSCGPVHATIPDESFACLARFSAAAASDEEIHEVLEQNQLALGQRIDHSFCIIDPGHKSTSANPVVVMESGIYCHSCAGRLGDGFRSWGAVRKFFHMDVAESLGVEPVMDAVKSFVVAPHAEYLISAVAPEIPEPCRRQLYSALLKRVHGDDPKVKTALTLRFGFVRGINNWLFEDTLEIAKRPLGASDVVVLPSAHYVDADGMTHPIQVDISKHINSGKIPGWTPVRPIRFVPIYAVHNEHPEARYALTCVPRKSLLLHEPVKYLPPDDRMPMVEAEQAIQNYFPGISLQYMKALLIAAGCAERGAGPIPMLWATGLTGAAKTTTVRIVQDMFGEPYENMSAIKEDRLDQVFGEALETTRLIMFDDYAKEPEHYSRLHTFFIRLNRQGHAFHRLFHGKSTLPVNSAIILTDWRKPEHFMTDPQFGRRVHIIHLGDVPISWEVLGRQLERWWKTSELLEIAAESLYSHIVDEYFPPGDQEGYATKMARLGVPLVRELNAPERIEHNEALMGVIHELVIGICNAKPLDDNSQRRLGAGYREILFGSVSAVGAACTALVDNLGHVEADQENLHRAIEPFNAKLQAHFDLLAPAMLQIRPYGKKLFIRLVEDHVSVRSSVKRFNRELFKQWPPVEPVKPVEEPVKAAEVIEEPPSAIPPPELTAEQIAALFNPDFTVPESKYGAMTAYLDYETQSACDLKKHGSYVYAEHVTTKAICAAVCFYGYRIFWTLDYFALKMPKGIIYQHGIEFFQKLASQPGLTVVAINVEFERAIWTRVLKLPEPARWLDVADISLMRGLPAGADHAGEYILGMGKDIEGYKLMMKTCKPDRKGNMPPITQAIVQRYIDYNFRDNDIALGIAERFGIDIQPPWENEVNQLHRAINYRGIRLDRGFAETLRSYDETFKALAGEAVELITQQYSPEGDRVTRADLTRNKFLLEWFGRRGLKMDNIRQDTLEQILEDAEELDVPVEIKSVIENRLVVTRAAMSKVDTGLRWMCADERIRAQFRYYGAHTGRWSGFGMQVQNFKRPDEDFDLKGAIETIERKDLEAFKVLCAGKPPYQLLSSLVRGVLIPSPGKVFISADFEQIEARAVLWLAEDWDGIQEHLDYDAGRAPDVYCRLASTLFKKTITKKEFPRERQAGKVGNLACGYGGGEGAVMRFAAVYNLDLAASGITPLDIRDAYRSRYARVPQLWRAYEDAFRRALRNQGRSYEAGRCVFTAFPDRVEIMLPSGRPLYYMNARVQNSTRQGWENYTEIVYDSAVKGKVVTKTLHGGIITENVDQAICRDFEAQKMIKIEREVGDIILHCHDEIMPEVDEKKADDASVIIKQIMCEELSWAPRMPLAAAPAIMYRYGK